MFAEILDAAGVPAGVFNLVQGDDPGVGVPLAGHADVDTISFTGSTRAGIDIARNAAPTVKRVTQELGGKSPDIVLDDEAFTENVGKGVTNMMGKTRSTASPVMGRARTWRRRVPWLAASGRMGRDQRRLRLRLSDRRVQEERQRAGVGRVRLPRLSGDQGDSRPGGDPNDTPYMPEAASSG
ncbi:aldehyde dehydrogenase family protein [Streptomyces sp. NPDC059441]|uniref:aldehyde dehydrogenase family protein n=1 Tax=Streptomyces sp. NPDC059441 TaxID=3346829 RepID=UPI0036A354F3